MGHQPFDTWIYERDELSLDQESQLTAHLAGCERCQSKAAALAQVDLMFETEPMMAPAAGFTQRWKRRLERRQRRQGRLQAGGITGLIFSGLTITAWLAGSTLWRWANGAADQIATWIDNLIRFVTQLRLAGRLYTILAESFLSQVPAVVWISLVMLAAIALALWIVSARKIVFQPN